MRPGAPSSGTPMIGGLLVPSARSWDPPYRPWSDSTRPIPASRVQESLQRGWVRAVVTCAYAYAWRATTGMSSVGDSARAQAA
jgi:hypothetical protein